MYKRRTGTKTDGCATCYRVSRFAEVSVSALEFYRPETKLLDRHNVAIVLLLRPAAPRGPSTGTLGPLLCVVNTHLLFNPRRGDVKLAQLAILLAEMHQMVQSQKARGLSCNLIVCGDFNSVPHMPLYQLITTGQLNYQGLPAWKVPLQAPASALTQCLDIKHVCIDLCSTDIWPRGPVGQSRRSQALCSPVALLSWDL